ERVGKHRLRSRLHQQIVSTWSFDHAKMNERKLLHARFKEESDLLSVKASSLCLSVCGNFVFIGYDSGHVDRFNIQAAFIEVECGPIKS
ncbi:Wdrepeat proteinlike, partial [Caligus rogercresseyi]